MSRRPTSYNTKRDLMEDRFVWVQAEILDDFDENEDPRTVRVGLKAPNGVNFPVTVNIKDLKKESN